MACPKVNLATHSVNTDMIETFYALCSIVSRTLCNINLQRDFDSARFVIRLNRVLHMSALRPKIQLKKVLVFVRKMLKQIINI